ncbi:MAG: hypothetical protein ACP5KW_11885 [Thermoproteota archaeon]|jgi:hypothetical protein
MSGEQKNDEKYVHLKVAEAFPVDVGRGIARIDPLVAKQLGLKTGNAIEIVGKKRTFALVWPAHPKDTGKGLIRIDDYTRKNAGVNVDDEVKIRKFEAKYAETLVLTSTEPLNIMNVEEYIRNQLVGRIVSKQDLVPIRVMGKTISLLVAEFTPVADAVIVYSNTNVKVSEAKTLEIPLEELKELNKYEDYLHKLEEEKKRGNISDEFYKTLKNEYTTKVEKMRETLPLVKGYVKHNENVVEVDFLVGYSYYTALQKNIWEKLGLKPKQKVVVTPDGQNTFERALSEAVIELPGYGEYHSPVLLEEEKDIGNYLGDLTLSIFGLSWNYKELQKQKKIYIAKFINAG